jgi:heme exporter protein CcmD
MNWHNFITMGGYGAYVWTAYGITLLAFGINLGVSFAEQKQVKKRVQQYLERSQ